MSMRFGSIPGVVLAVMAGLALMAACSTKSSRSDDDDGAGGSTVIVEYWCVCNDNSANTVDANPSAQCVDHCADHGGVREYVQVQSVATSTECDAFCARVTALDCGDCNRLFECQVSYSSCPAATRAQLACGADVGEFSCLSGGDGWEFSADCGTFQELCSPDAGAP
jgi:hypothetical protein